MKILWVGDAVKPTGFARVTHAVVAELTKRGHEVAILGVNYEGDPHPFPWRIYPAGNTLGAERLAAVYNREKPDLVFLLGDSWVLSFYLEVLPETAKIVAYVPVDAANQWAAAKLNRISTIVAYTTFGARELRKGGYKGPIAIVPHGVDTSVFYPVPDAREQFGLPEPLRSGFLFGNVNRNSPRKRQDLTIKFFAEWWDAAGRPPDAFLVLHCAMIDAGWDLEDLGRYYGVGDRLVFTGTKDMSTFASETKLRLVYNMLDCQLGTGMGEGWGLTVMEGLACGVRQVHPFSSALAEWGLGVLGLVPCNEDCVATAGVNTIGKVPDRAAFIEAMDFEYRRGRRLAPEADALALATDPRYTWAAVGQQFHDILTEVAGV